MSSPEETNMEIRPSLNKLNYLNLLFYVLNFLMTYGIGTMGWLGTGSNGEISDKYQSLVTPNSSAFSIWALIFVSQLIFSVIQMFPRFRARPLVQQGVGYWWILACVFQIGWTFAFAYEVIWLSLVLIASIYFALVALLYSQYYIEPAKDQTRGGSILEYFLFQFPFAIHAGWLAAATMVNLNVLAVDLTLEADTQLAMGIISLAVLHAVAVWTTFAMKKANYVMSLVLAWATFWVSKELQNPMTSIIDRFAENAINGVRLASVSVSVIILVQIVLRVVFDVVSPYIWSSSNDKDGDEASAEESESNTPIEEAENV